MEKEAFVKGVPIGQALDIDIPPPRPKRKPNNPYPRKTNVGGAPTLHSGARHGKPLISIVSSLGKQALGLEKEPLPEVIFIFMYSMSFEFSAFPPFIEIIPPVPLEA